jgi:hypothetical protein
MAGVVPILPPRTGNIAGKLDIQAERSITLDELLTHFTSSKTFLNELTDKGWKYHFIDGYGKVALELILDSYQYNWQTYEHPRGGFAYKLELDFERRLPKLQLISIIRLDKFVVNICSRDYPRGVTIDLLKNEVTYVHDSLWILKGKDCIEEAKDVLKILEWLVEEKKFNLAVDGGESYYRKLITALGGK